MASYYEPEADEFGELSLIPAVMHNSAISLDSYNISTTS